jgi:pantothenate kinase
MEDPEEKHRRRGAHWTFNAPRFVADLGLAKAEGQGSFPSFDHAEGDPREDDIKVRWGRVLDSSL